MLVSLFEQKHGIIMDKKEKTKLNVEEKLDEIIEKNRDGANALKKIINAINSGKEKKLKSK